MSSPNYKIDMEQAGSFLRLWFRNLQSGECIEIRGFDPAFQEFFESVRSCERWLQEAPFFQALYYGVNPRRVPGGSRSRGGKNNLSSLIGLYADIDHRNLSQPNNEMNKPSVVAVAIERLLQVGPRPDFILSVDSGYGVHILVPFGESISATTESIGAYNQAERRLVHALDGDSRAQDAARVLRLPGSLNMKSSPFRRCVLLDHPHG